MGAASANAAPNQAWKRTLNDVSADGFRIKRFVLTPSASYASGGETFTPADVGLVRIEGVLLEANDAMLPSTAYRIGRGVTFDLSNVYAPKMRYWTAANTEAGAASDQSGHPVAAWIFGH